MKYLMIICLLFLCSCASKMDSMFILASENPGKQICGDFFMKEDPSLSHSVGTYCIIFKGKQ